MTGDFAIRAAEVSDMPACAAIKNAWVDETDWMLRVRPADRLERHYREDILPVSTFVVAERMGEVAGFLAVESDGDVDSLYVATDARGLGIGRALLDAARTAHPEGLKLWTFQANEGAQRFYLREGFREETRTEGENEEGLPDILYVWGRAP